MRKNFNKLATLALSGMMVMSMAMPAMAATKLPFHKILHTDGNTYAPDTTFTFTVEKNTDASITMNGKNFTNNQIVGEAKDAIEVEAVKFTPEDGLGIQETGNGPDGEPVGAHFDKTTYIKIKDKAKFDKLGYYFFKMEENEPDPAYEGIKYSKAKFTIVVIKEKPKNATDDGFTIIVQRNDQLTSMTKVDKIENNYGKHFPPNPDPNPNPNPGPNPNPDDDTTHDVIIRKKTKGGLVDKTSFKFTIEVVPQPGASEKFKVTEVNENTTNITESNETALVKGTPKSFTIPVDHGVRIYGLTKSDLIKVHEEDGSTYIMTVAPAQGKDSYLVAGSLDTNDLANYNTEFKVQKDKAEVHVTNEKGVTPPTGIVMNVAPYAMMLAVAGGLGVVFVNRKKEEE